MNNPVKGIVAFFIIATLRCSNLSSRSYTKYG